MGNIDLIYLVVGISLGLWVSRFTRSNKPPLVSTASLPQEVDTEMSSPQKAPKTSLPQTDHDEGPLKEELKQAKLAYEMAQEWSKFKAGFLARTSHELRSPLSSLIGMHQLILTDLCDSPEEEREFVAQANTSALKMVKLLTEVTEISKIEHGTMRLDIRSQPLSKVFEDVHLLTHLQAANSNLQFEVVSPEPEIYVTADPRRIRQALAGIVDAAIAQMEERKEGSIKVSAFCPPDAEEVRIWIDIKTPASIWSEPTDLLSTTPEINKQPSKTPEIPPGLNFLLIQTIVDAMQGRLEVLPIPSEETTSTTIEQATRLQCSMPLGTLETVEQALVVDPL